MRQVLAQLNSHSRDQYITFYARGHKYFISSDPKSKYTSVTTFIHSLFPKFDADLIISKMMNSKKWGPDHKYWGQTPEQIKESWKQNGNSVASAGTSMHETIEAFMNQNILAQTQTQTQIKNHKMLYDYYVENPNNQPQFSNFNSTPEWSYFLKFILDNENLIPYRTEWMIFHEEAKLAGSIDMVYINEDGTLSIYDWKRAKEITKYNSFDEFALNPHIAHLHHTNFWHYSLQLNIYKKILETKYDKIVSKLALIRLHPNSETQSYELLEVPFLEKEVDDLFNERINNL